MSVNSNEMQKGLKKSIDVQKKSINGPPLGGGRKEVRMERP